MESAAIAMMETNATATSAMVKPRSVEGSPALLRGRRIIGDSTCASILVKCRSVGCNAGWTRKRSTHQTGYAVELPLVRVLNGDACSDQIYCVDFLDAAPIDGEHERGGGSARGSSASKNPSKLGSRKGAQGESAGRDILRDKVVVDHLKGISDRSRDGCFTKVVGWIGSCWP